MKALLFLLLLTPQILWAHARLTSPAPRNTNSGIKSGPCGGLARTGTPTVLQAGATVPVSWEETINHPGKYIISFSQSNDANFSVLATVTDTQNGTNNLPHVGQTMITVPNTPCSNCTLQLIQSMEENPASPTYYYSCADIQIVAAGGPPVQTQSFSSQSGEKVYPEFKQGCGTIRNQSSSDRSSYWVQLFLLIPLLLWTALYLKVPVLAREK